MHLLDMSNGRANMAYTGEKPWHGLGFEMSPTESLDSWRGKAGLAWDALHRPAGFMLPDQDDPTKLQFAEIPGKRCIYRSDNKAPLSIVSNEYEIVQPAEVVEFYRDLCEKHGFTMETAGSLREGRVIWALAKANLPTFDLQGKDQIGAFLLLTTSFDYSSSTVAKFTSVRTVCNNTLGMALDEQGRTSISIPHSRKFDADQVKIELSLGDAWYDFQETVQKMASTKITEEDTVKFFLKVYHGTDVPDDRRREKILINRLAGILKNAPGADLSTAQGTVWGVVNAITYDVDHVAKAATPDRRLVNAWLGSGDKRKQVAWDMAKALV